MSLDSKIDAILFFKGEPITKKKLAQLADVEINSLEEALNTLEERLKNGGLILVRTDEEVSLGTSPEASKIIEDISREELERDLGKAGLETLSIIIYRGPISRSSVDNIRGVNSSFIIRNLLIRGLVDRVFDPKDQRSYLYKPSMQLLSYLGVSSIDNMPEYVRIVEATNVTALDQEEENGGPESK